ncbi:hypothetical protein, partial [Methylobacterium sp. WL19]|uniref:hypothetical protein n=1 Tax=Methylobacterium sp. WL19 TaxID=2603896 RepID=UPI00164F3FCD
VNGLARAWSTDMAVYTSKKWKKVVDAGFASDSVFSRDETSKIIQTANDLCPISKGDFIGETWRRLKLGEQRAQEIGRKYGM